MPEAEKNPREHALIGQRIGHYRILQPLGRGGMSTVFAAVHEQLGHRAAIKVLHAEMRTSAEGVGRFFNEARAANVVQHPGIVTTFAFEQLQDGTPCIIMEHLEGERLSLRLRRHQGQRLPGALLLMRQVASALQAVHEQGIVHRDLKPGNVMIVRDPDVPGGERAKLLDFGIAKLRDEHLRSQDDRVHTQTGTLMGTPAYMSPEQCRGEGQLDGKTDVYSLGLMLFAALAGRLPFTESGVMALLAMHMEAEPPLLRSLDAEVPPALEALVAAMLAKAPAARPTMKQVEEELTRIGASWPAAPSLGGLLPGGQAGETETAIEQTGGGTTWLTRPARRHWLIAAALGLGALGLTLALSARLAGEGRGIPRPLAGRWSLDSRPTGAEVVRAADGMVLGRTPFTGAPGPGPLELILRKPGYFDKHIQLDPAQGAARTEALQEITNDQIPLLR